METGWISESGAMRAVISQIEAAAPHDAFPVHFTGESGTGKELGAKYLHEKSSRWARAFLALNCAAVPDTLLEAELFGHTRGAFTGAERARRGLLEEAHQGTLFLDEVADLSPRGQTILLRVLQEKEYRRLGDSLLKRSDFRVVSASHKDLRREVEAGRFREDLFYRLSVIRIAIPPLRQRPEDIVPLARRYLRSRVRESTYRMTPELERALTRYEWPGNVRELENELACSIVRAGGETKLGVETLSLHVRRCTTIAFRAATRELERKLVEDALVREGGNRTRAARALGISRQGLYRKLRRLGLHRSATT